MKMASAMTLPSAGTLLTVGRAASEPGQKTSTVRQDHDVIVTASPLVQLVLAQARKVAASKASVLVEGESGTGKEALARLIHISSPRTDQPYARINCAALPENLAESELFGHEKGSFTGADEVRRGRFEATHGGTLLLDEIGEMSAGLQAKLLRVLEEGEFERVGSNHTLPTDVRILATTNRDLQRAVAAGTFRADLLYRLNAVHLRLPPLRERREDIAVLARHFFQCYRQEAATDLKGIGTRAMRLLQDFDWPGNVRQLRNAVQRACLLAEGQEIQPEDLPPLCEPTPAVAEFRGQTLAEMERQLIGQTLREVGGNRTAAAQRLGITTRTLLNKLTRYRELDAA